MDGVEKRVNSQITVMDGVKIGKVGMSEFFKTDERRRKIVKRNCASNHQRLREAQS